MMTNPRKDKARLQAGVIGKANYIGQTDHSGKAFEVNACQCRLNRSGCLYCRRWDRTIREIEARRAASLRRQSLGDLARAGGI